MCDAVYSNGHKEIIHSSDEWNSSVYCTDITTDCEQMVNLDVDQPLAMDDAVNIANYEGEFNNKPIMCIENFDGTLNNEDNEENFRFNLDSDMDEFIWMIRNDTSNNFESNSRDGTGYYKLIIG